MGIRVRKVSEAFLTVIGLAFAFVGLLVFASFVEGFTFCCLWRWFVVPLGLPEISTVHSVGLSLIISFLTYHHYNFKKDDEVGALDTLGHLLVRPITTLALGWLLHFFI